MTDPDASETTAGGPLGRLIGKAKEVAGKVIGQGDLAREGRLQQAQADAEARAQGRTAHAEQLQSEQQLEAAKQENELERQRLQTEIAATERDAALERERRQAEQAVTARAQREQLAVEQRRQMQEHAASATAQRAAAERTGEEQRAARLEQEAAIADAKADVLDPEEN